LSRYYKIILQHKTSALHKKPSGSYKNEADYSGYLDVLKVVLMSPCESLPDEHMDEMCKHELKNSLIN